MTRKEYLDANRSSTVTCNVTNAERIHLHRRYYAQFVTINTRSLVLGIIGIKRLLSSKKESFNDIPLSEWDSMCGHIPAGIAAKMRELGDYPTLAGYVCVLKEAARQIVEDAK